MADAAGGEAAIPDITPFGAQKNAEQQVQLAIDPSDGLTRKRYGWFSNGTLFDSTLFSEVESGIRVATTATSGDAARIRSAHAGQYVAQTLAQPGLGLVIDDGNVTRSNGLTSLSHGELYAGAFFWDPGAAAPSTGLGFHFDTAGWEFFIRSLGSHIGPSPVPQSRFSADSYDGSGASSRVRDPSQGFVINLPYTWYNQGPLGAGLLDKAENRVREVTMESVLGSASIDTANLPVQMVVRNDGTASPLGAELGGMQFSTYGAGAGEIETRATPESRNTVESGYISDTRALTENAVDPTAEPGKPLVAARRQPGEEDLRFTSTGFSANVTGDDIYIFTWDEFDPGAALTGASFTQPVTPNNAGLETEIETDTQATDYTPSMATFRDFQPLQSGKNEYNYAESNVDVRVPIGATRIWTAVREGRTTSDADVRPFVADLREGY